MIKYPAALLLLVFSFTLIAQTPQTGINLYGEKLPAEKIHVHFDKDIYLPGETIWFKAYLFEENLPTQRSTNFYISLYNQNGQAIEQKLCPVINATANGFFTIPDTITASQLLCRAYTGWMLNFDSSFLFTKTIKLYTTSQQAAKQNLTTSLHFFAEGGDVIENERNTIAFKANYSNGLPYNFSVVIKKQGSDDTLAAIQTQHDGMGRFDLEIEPGQTYYAAWTDNTGTLQKTILPQAKANGVSFKMVQQKNKLIYNIASRLPQNDSVYIIAWMYQSVVYNKAVAITNGDRYTGMFETDSLPAGVLQLTVFDSNRQPVAERICFINNNYAVTPALQNKNISLQKRSKNEIEIAAADTIPANMSLSITDADFNNEQSEENIFTSMLLRGDIRGYIHKPAYYFNAANKEAKGHLDLVMLTHGWRRYNWDALLAGKLPAINYQPDNYLSAYGQISENLLPKLKKDETVNLVVKTKDSTTNYFLAMPDKKGLLKYENLFFYDTARLYYSFNTQKEYNKQMTFGKSNYTLAQPQWIPAGAFLQKDTTGTNISNTVAVFKHHLANSNAVFNKEKTLQAVSVKSGGWRNWKNDPIIKLDERYTNGMFSGGANVYAVDLIHDESSWKKLDIFNYIRNKIPGLFIGSYNAVYGRPLTFRDKGVIIYIDEVEVTANELENLTISQVAYVKFIPNFMGRGMDAGGSSVAPVLSVYSRKGSDLIDRTPKESDLGMVKIAGYSPVKEFYAPDYSQNNNLLGNDARTTLLWLPYIFTDKNNLSIPVTFYNNDFTKRFKVILEGINEEGKLIYIEKIIE
jgi:hypothetical protein